MDNKLKRIIIIILVICIILLITIISMLSLYKNEEADMNADLPINREEEMQGETELKEKIVSVQSEADFFTLEKQLKNYFLYLSVGNKEAIYNLLQNEYINEKQITQDNVVDIIKQDIKDTKGDFYIKQAYVRDSIIKPIYYLYGILENGQSKSDYYMIVYWDQENIAYAIKPISKEIYNKYITASLKEENNYNITSQKYNKLEKTTLSEEERAIKYFKSYIKNALHNTEKAYESIDEKYKQQRFGNIEEYKNYLNNKKLQLLSMDTDNIKEISDFKTEEEYTNYLNNLKFKSIEKYKFTNTNSSKQCICIDAYGNYYIFNITAAMNYTVILDTYTVDLPEFTEKYENASNGEKVLMNIQRFFDAIDDGDYKYAYGKLDETYKANNFKTQADFENYIKKTFFEKNKLAAGTAEKQDDIYLYKVTISDETGTKTNEVTKTFVMQLKEGTDFVMSFSVN